MEKENKKAGMSNIVKVVASWQRTFIFMFGLYLIAYGQITIGGGFAGGIIIAGTFILTTLAFGKEIALGKLGRLLAFRLASIGGIFLILTAVINNNFRFTHVLVETPSGNFALFSAGFIPIYNLGLGIIIGASFFMIFIILSMHRIININGTKKLIITKKWGQK
ncbi:MAG: hypothetical protein M1135_03310 [Candidatus Omnitrophica bacterium]|jgi:multicomponent Na+:H+ antiporter subunit B|nr:hypothetical protein [Candidatus Omnitrophota bacterium]